MAGWAEPFRRDWVSARGVLAGYLEAGTAPHRGQEGWQVLRVVQSDRGPLLSWSGEEPGIRVLAQREVQLRRDEKGGVRPGVLRLLRPGHRLGPGARSAATVPAGGGYRFREELGIQFRRRGGSDAGHGPS